MKILVINAGSSSLKYQLFDMEKREVLAKGNCERIGIGGHIEHKRLIGQPTVSEEDLSLPTHAEAIAAIVNKLTDRSVGVVRHMDEIDAVGHRVVQGGEAFRESVLITDEVIQVIEDCIPLAPLHNPANIMGINACRAVIGDVPMVAVFDTAFHHTMPKKAFTYALPIEYYTRDRVRHYGFHGTSHRYVAGRAAALLGRPVEELKLISCHMGNGSSICAIQCGESVDTSMGFTPVDGLPMGTRSGEIDPGVIQFLMGRYGYSIDEMLDILNKKSGILGISGISSDFRDVQTAKNKGDERARLAIDLFTYNCAKFVGSYAAAMNGLDAVIFTAGVGENDAAVRRDVSAYLSYLGCTLDENLNLSGGGERFISTPDSRTKLMVIPTNEELVIAQDTMDIVRNLAAPI
ncbi:MAG: acetate kinase [Firmicutes bacterium]|nr:acetate kinase [Bacillota bacterium]